MHMWLLSIGAEEGEISEHEGCPCHELCRSVSFRELRGTKHGTIMNHPSIGGTKRRPPGIHGPGLLRRRENMGEHGFFRCCKELQTCHVKFSAFGSPSTARGAPYEDAQKSQQI